MRLHSTVLRKPDRSCILLHARRVPWVNSSSTHAPIDRTGMHNAPNDATVSPAHATTLLRWAVVVGLLVRLVILWQTGGLGTGIVDEQHYRLIASNIYHNGEFAAAPGEPTSIRPPLYPGLVAAVWAVTSPQNLQAVRVVQIILGLGTRSAGVRAWPPGIQSPGGVLCSRALLAVSLAHLLQLPDSHRDAVHVSARALRAAHSDARSRSHAPGRRCYAGWRSGWRR